MANFKYLMILLKYELFFMILESIFSTLLIILFSFLTTYIPLFATK